MITYLWVKNLIEHFDPSSQFSPQGPEDWKGEFPLPDALIEYYQKLGPLDVEIDAPGNPYCLPSLTRLWHYQAGYRWNGLTGSRLETWNDDWLVVADEGGDPYILSRSQGHVMMDHHGRGAWKPQRIFSGLLEMSGTFAVIGEIVRSVGCDHSIRDQAGNISSDHIAQAERRLSEVTGSRRRAQTILRKLAWS